VSKRNKDGKPFSNPLVKWKMFLFVVVFIVLVFGIALYDVYHVSVLTDALY
jgi:hypothetical protein